MLPSLLLVALPLLQDAGAQDAGGPVLTPADLAAFGRVAGLELVRVWSDGGDAVDWVEDWALHVVVCMWIVPPIA